MEFVLGGEILELLEEFRVFTEKPILEPATKKVFSPVHKEIPLLLDYSGVAPKNWWLHWPSLSWEEGRVIKSTICPLKMVAWARRAGHPDMSMVMDIARDLRGGV